jgi:hypothetical protein
MSSGAKLERTVTRTDAGAVVRLDGTIDADTRTDQALDGITEEMRLALEDVIVGLGRATTSSNVAPWLDAVEGTLQATQSKMLPVGRTPTGRTPDSLELEMEADNTRHLQDDTVHVRKVGVNS